MSREIDNFPFVYNNILQFDGKGEFYLALILKRRKDTEGKMLEGVNEDNRLIKHYFLYDSEYLHRKEDSIKQLCVQNNARAYILPQRRTCRLALWALHDKVSEALKNGSMNVHFDHLIRSCVAGMHEVPVGKKWQKRWVLDIDKDDKKTFAIANKIFFPWQDSLIESLSLHIACRLQEALIPDSKERTEAVKKFMPEVEAAYYGDKILLMRTPNGYHIVTPPFNRDPEACEKYFGGWNPEWVKTDAMALMYSPEMN